MSQHDEYDRNILRALQKIGKHLESMDKKLSISPEKVDYDDKENALRRTTAMVKTRNDSELKIWSLAEINNPAVRDPKYEKAEILQIEPGCDEYEYIVEVLVKTDEIAYWEDVHKDICERIKNDD
mgnify:CR=1 FL=1|jgi:hypothetical protein